MRNKNNYDRTGSSQDFSNNEGYHDYQDYTERSFKNTPHFADRQRSQYDDGMNRSERNDYRTDSDYRTDYQRSQYQGSQYPSSYQGQGKSQIRNEWNRPTLQNSDRYESQSHHFSADYSQRPTARQGTYDFDSASRGSSLGGNWQSGRSSTGMYTGKGPKGYRRSDDRIKEDVCESLQDHPAIDASEIEIDVKDGMVTLSGTVDSRQVKRMAEDCVERLSGVSDVKNDLRVMASMDTYGKSKPTSTTSMSSDLTSDSDSQTRSNPKTNLAGRQSSSTSTSSSKSVQ